MITISSSATGGLDLFAIKLLLAALVLTVATIVALVAAMVSRLTPATSIAQSAIFAGAAFAGTATLLLVAISCFASL
ncbi:hypothetical protein ACFYPA_27155 [Streptomyces sp. NPDC005775]|uniref:hypothetical protein n=1 Tax=Streptomyces sp. NPDC005775 TaxID=3364729 RepID=UPI003674809B